MFKSTAKRLPLATVIFLAIAGLVKAIKTYPDVGVVLAGIALVVIIALLLAAFLDM